MMWQPLMTLDCPFERKKLKYVHGGEYLRNQKRPGNVARLVGFCDAVFIGEFGSVALPKSDKAEGKGIRRRRKNMRDDFCSPPANMVINESCIVGLGLAGPKQPLLTVFCAP